ncbi:MAG TPA: hypothetical protein VGT79_03315 [Xanthomonadaceae bacterium]|nr:hypothetical protein [Xanthomonadaceae bacterium]
MQQKIDSQRDTIRLLENDVLFVDEKIENFARKIEIVEKRIEILEKKIEKVGHHLFAAQFDPCPAPTHPHDVRNNIDPVPGQMPSIAGNIVVLAKGVPSIMAHLEWAPPRIDLQPDTIDPAGMDPRMRKRDPPHRLPASIKANMCSTGGSRVVNKVSPTYARPVGQ